MRAAAARRPRFPNRVSGTPDSSTGIGSTMAIVIAPPVACFAGMTSRPGRVWPSGSSEHGHRTDSDRPSRSQRSERDPQHPGLRRGAIGLPGNNRQEPCPACAAFIDQLEGAAEHVSQHVNLAVVAKTPLPRLLTFTEERGCRRRFLSSAKTRTTSTTSQRRRRAPRGPRTALDGGARPVATRSDARVGSRSR